MVYATKTEPRPHLKRVGYDIHEVLPIQLEHGSQSYPQTLLMVPYYQHPYAADVQCQQLLPPGPQYQ